tara:strand:+ start:123 stop:560 length:438 start_codon:yes stop_codon:yes gene_type:complete
MTEQEWQDEMASYDLDVPTRNAVEKLKPYMSSDMRHVASATDIAVADLIENGYDKWSDWESDKVVESVRLVSEKFTQEVIDDTKSLLEMELMIDGMVDSENALILCKDLHNALQIMRNGMLDMMFVAEHYLILHEEVIAACSFED